MIIGKLDIPEIDVFEDGATDVDYTTLRMSRITFWICRRTICTCLTAGSVITFWSGKVTMPTKVVTMILILLIIIVSLTSLS